jgi:glycosyltransferase involved in cell wall biosynthesis
MVPRSAALAAQAEADVLLHLLWNDAEHTGVYGAKIFEYLRSRRPVLAVGADTGNVTARLVTERGAGVATSDPAVIANKLREWIELLDAGKPIPATPANVSAGLSRLDQTKKFESFIKDVLTSPRGAA